MKNYLLAVCAAILLFTIGCEKDKIVTPKMESSNINFNNLEVGQINTYLRYTAIGYRDTASHNNFSYTKDTLHAEVVNQDGEFFVVEEYLTRNSEILANNEGQFFEDTISYKMKISADTLFIQGEPGAYHSYLFTQFSTADWNVSDDRLMKFPLAEINTQQVEVKGWKTTSPGSESYNKYFATKCEILGKDYGRVNIVEDNVPMQVDGSGSTYIYNNEFGFIRSFNYGWWVDNGTGWDLMPAE